MNFSNNLKKLRKEKGLSQEELAEKLNVSRQSVSKWESGATYPEMDKVLLICKLFDCNINEIMHEDVSQVSEVKESKNVFNKYVDDFFAYITKTVDKGETTITIDNVGGALHYTWRHLPSYTGHIFTLRLPASSAILPPHPV